MGRVARWLKAIFGLKSNREQKEGDLNSGDRRDKRRSSFGHSRRDSSSSLCHNPVTIPPNITAAEAARLKSYYTESEKEQHKQAIAVAAATAAAADAAVAAAQVAVAVAVKGLTSHGKGTMFAGGRKRWAAVKIQTTFRGYLARKALRALRSLVKLQALVRGYLVRKQATATLHGMEALIRAQATVRSKRVQGFIENQCSKPQLELRALSSMENIFYDSRSENFASVHSGRLSASFETKTSNPIDESSMIVEVDTGRLRSRQLTRSTEGGNDPSYQKLNNSLPFLFPPPHLSIPNSQHFQDHEWGLTGEECRFSTAQCTPRFMSSCVSNPPLSICADNFFSQYTNHPNYMANTRSFEAKLRSQSAPKQRPEAGSKKRLSVNEIMGSRNSLSGVWMQRSCSQAQVAINFKNAVMGKLERSSNHVRESAQRHYAPKV